MPPSELFRIPVTADKLSLFRSLFESDELNADLALALLKVIHGELSAGQLRQRSVYKNYAGAIQTLRHRNMAMLERVAAVWDAGRAPKDPEWLEDGKIK